MARATLPRSPALSLFVVPGFDLVNGGLISIQAILEESRLRANQDWKMHLVTPRSDPRVERFTKFPSERTVQRIDDVLAYNGAPDRLVIFVAEVACAQLVEDLDWARRKGLLGRSVRVHVLLQNIDLLDQASIRRLASQYRLTVSTAHERYANAKLEADLGVPVRHLGVRVGPENYRPAPFAQRRNVMIVSPDAHPLRQDVLGRIARELPDIDLRVIRRLPYQEYLRVIREAKWALTFGEGLDGYLVETVFSGGVGFAAYNDRFFTPDFREVPGIHADMADLGENIVKELRAWANEAQYASVQEAQFEVCARHYQSQPFKDRLTSLLRDLDLL
ncbi:MAG: hypothetical protein AABY18_02795 [Candidatus Thermoplasmatota archaeon]